ncbi:cell division ATP-binding protein FtsE [candidate division WWE3 bacterium RBG_19FT_COMBO_34_6]|uniref:Cell division ATP-binding protein FtsE n=1 Tax=candidate division WWE3 bacterium RBG_19FT_COMBO_34_6 TaxID=1802612 RepID=A0A1F4UN83_UNCKA|nr:MAG: cell division ATP-binding protein FtsE [candidate division WWE3 bacterium RBG_19FT_COMBO_34_6]
MQIDFRDITKEYEQQVKALDNISFGIERGEFVFIVGESGAGKTTLIKLLIKEEEPTAGQILFDDVDLSAILKDDISQLRRRVGVVFQDFKLLESKDVFENVAIALDVVDSNDDVIKNVVPNVLSLVGLTHKMHSPPSKLSGGEKQRVSIARALAHEPDVLIADEPTGMIDPKSAMEIMEILEKINSLGTTVVMATHNRDIVDSFKKRVIRLEKGKIISDKKKGTYAQ